MEQKHDNQRNAPKTPGEKTFDLIAYWGLGGVANSIFSLKLFKWTHYEWENLSKAEQETHLGKKIHDIMYDGAANLAKPLEGVLGESKLVDGKAFGALKHSQRFMLGSILGLGGWVALAGIKPMEDNKPALVNQFNQWQGYTPSQEQLDDLHHEPKQSWGSLLGGRVAAYLTPIFAAMPIMDAYEKARGQEIFDDLADISRRNFGGALRLEKYVNGMSREAGRQWTKTGFAEAFYTVVAVTLLFGVSKFLAHSNDDEMDVPKNPLITGNVEEEKPRKRVRAAEPVGRVETPQLTQEVRA